MEVNLMSWSNTLEPPLLKYEDVYHLQSSASNPHGSGAAGSRTRLD